MFDNLDYDELILMLLDAIEMRDGILYDKIKEEINKRIKDYE